jgi:DNA (cytosine-5)-methyltransferase 1
VRHITQDAVLRGQIPTPYDRDGQGDFYYLSSRLVTGTDRIEPLTEEEFSRMDMNHGINTRSLKASLNGPSLFSGGGNMDGGIEEGGAAKTRWAVEWNVVAAHSFRAAKDNPGKVGIYLGSVDDHLKKCIDGRTSSLIPAIGDVHTTTASSPCQGFSAMQQEF